MAFKIYKQYEKVEVITLLHIRLKKEKRLEDTVKSEGYSVAANFGMWWTKLVQELRYSFLCLFLFSFTFPSLMEGILSWHFPGETTNLDIQLR
jgi:hypothetical protein